MNCKNYMGKPNFLAKKSLLNGYVSIRIKKKDGRTTVRYVHKLVAQHFLEQNNGIFVIHKDYDKLNNHVDNLSWATKKQKEQHQFANPLFKEAVKNRKEGKNYKLTENKVRLIKKKLNDPNRKTRLKMIAKQFGISEMQLYRIKSGENWGHVKSL